MGMLGIELLGGLVLAASVGAADAPPRLAPSPYDEVRGIYLDLRQLPEGERQEKAAQEVETLTPLLATSDESTVSHAAEVLRLAGCRAAPALPELKAALSRFRGPEALRDDLLSYVVPAGAWGALYNAIVMIESDGQCGAPTDR
jgi:hypothetical protein